MIVLGLNHGEFNSSAAIFSRGRITAGCPEERFSREKRTKAFPEKAVRYCLDSLGIKLKDCDCVAQGWNPGAAWLNFNPLLSSFRIKREDYFYSVPDNLYNLSDRRPGDWVRMSFPEGYSMPEIYYVHHHRSHAANAFFLSPHERAAILTCDGRGEIECTTFGYAEGNDIKILMSQAIPNSLGMFYAAYTELLGYRPDSDEWKVMALSAFDVPFNKYYSKIKSTVRLCRNGLFEMDGAFYKSFLAEQPHLYTDRLVSLLGGRIGYSGEKPDEWHFSVAKAMQKVSEEVAFNMLKELYRITKCRNLVLGGGFFMNSVFNGKVAGNSDFRNVYISYAPADLGNSIGAALYVAHCLKRAKRDHRPCSSLIGPEFTDSQIEQSLIRRKIQYEYVRNRDRRIAELLSQGEIVAVMNGRMEFGERALGNRSILADPRRSDIKDRVNSAIKYRESYRPFAPAAIREKAHIYFEVEKGYECRHMEKVVRVRKEYGEKLPAITHADGSARLQTVERAENGPFYGVLIEFEKLTGFPIVLNTSFNINKEPIVLNPDDALNTFFNSGLEYLFIGPYLIRKKER